MIRTHLDGTLPIATTVFVFGSNLRGVHGAGAAKEALKYGAMFGHGVGRVGQSYAIPTKDAKMQTLPLKDIEHHVAVFKQYARANPATKFFVTRVGCGLAGFTDDVIAPMFAPALSNCNYPDNWKKYIGG